MRLSKGASLAGIIAITENLFSMPAIESVDVFVVKTIGISILVFFCNQFFNSK